MEKIVNESTDFEKLSELPQSLIFDAFEQIKDIEQELLKSFDDLRERKKEFREKLNGSGLLKHDASLPEKQSPTTCGVDGAYDIDTLSFSFEKNFTVLFHISLAGLIGFCLASEIKFCTLDCPSRPV